MYQDRFSSGIDLGYHDKVRHFDPAHAARLKANVAEFSAYKEAAFKRDIKALLGADRETFKAKAKEISGLYNKTWFGTEYHHAVAAANMSAKWAQYEERKHLYPNLRYVAVQDGRTRESHARWHGTTLPVDDPWWDTHLPPNDWGCRCGVTQTDKPVTKTPSGEVKDTFANNPGKTGKVFVESGYAKSLGESARKEADEWAGKIFRETPFQKAFIKKQRQEIKEYGKQNLLQSVVNITHLKRPIAFNKTGFKEFANQPFQFETEKLFILKNIDELIKTAKYKGYRFSENPMIRRSHIFEIKVKNETCWIVVRERLTGENYFYSISDSPKIAEGLKKE